MIINNGVFFFFLSFIYLPNSVCFGYKINYVNTIDKHLFITHIEKVSCNRKKRERMIQAIQASVEVDEIKVPIITNSGFGFDVCF